MKTLILLAFVILANVFAGEMQEIACGDKSLSYCINHFDRQCEAKNYASCNVVGVLHNEQKQYSEAKKYFEMVCDKANSKDSYKLELIDGSMGAEVPAISIMQVNCMILGILYYDGLGVRQSYEKALQYYKKACDLGNKDSCYIKENVEKKENIAKCLGGNLGACDYIADIMGTYGDSVAAEYKLKNMVKLNCNDYMKAMRKGCNLGSGLCCALLGDEFHSISVNSGGKWFPKYGANCSLRNQNEAFKYYKKACELGESAGCQRYTELQNDIDEIDRRERDKTQKSDITIRQR